MEYRVGEPTRRRRRSDVYHQEDNSAYQTEPEMAEMISEETRPQEETLHYVPVNMLHYETDGALGGAAAQNFGNGMRRSQQNKSEMPAYTIPAPETMTAGETKKKSLRDLFSTLKSLVEKFKDVSADWPELPTVDRKRLQIPRLIYAGIFLIMIFKILLTPLTMDDYASVGVFTFLPPILQAIQRSLYGPVFCMLEYNSVLTNVLSVVVGLAVIIFLPPERKEDIDWDNDPNAQRKAIALLALWVIVLLSALPGPIRVPVVSDLIVSWAVQFSHTLQNAFGVILEWVLRAGIGALAVWQIGVALNRIDDLDFELELKFGIDRGVSAKGSIGDTTIYTLMIWGIGIVALAILTLIVYLLVPTGSIILAILAAILAIVTYAIAAAGGAIGGFMISHLQEGRLGKVFLYTVFLNCLLGFPVAIFSDFTHNGASRNAIYHLSSGLYDGMESLSNFMTAHTADTPGFSFPMFSVFAVWLTIFCAGVLIGLFYAWIEKCPYCGRYGGRATEISEIATVGEKLGKRVTSKTKDVSVRDTMGQYVRADQVWNDGSFKVDNFMHSYDTDLLGRLDAEVKYEVKEQQFVEKKMKMRKHVHCIYCRENLQDVTFTQTRKEDIGEAQVSEEIKRQRVETYFM